MAVEIGAQDQGCGEIIDALFRLAAGGAALASTLSPTMMKKSQAASSTTGGKITEVKTICTHCSVGCGIIAEVQNGVWTGQEPAFDHPFNQGAHCAKGASIRDGVLASAGDFVVYTDADLVYPIEGAYDIIAALERGADVAIASRSNEQSLFAMHPRHFAYIHRRYLIGRIYIRIVNRILGLGVSDTQAGFKCFRGDRAREVFRQLRIANFAFDVEALYIARRLGLRIVELPVYFHYQGERSGVALIKDSIRMFRSLLEIRANGRRGRYGSISAGGETGSERRRTSPGEPRGGLDGVRAAGAAPPEDD